MYALNLVAPLDQVRVTELLRSITCATFLVCLAGRALAQDTLEVELPAIEIEATRAFETTMNAARSVHVKRRTRAAQEPGISLQRSLRGIPGLRINDRGHFALGERLLIRGMGYRAAFGVRGTQAFLDGIPLTMADGQSMLDVVDPVFVGRAELLRGPSSLYWGNASGGVLYLTTQPDTSAVRLRYMGGSYGLSQTVAEANLRQERQTVQLYGSRLARNGYRTHSSGSFIRTGTHVKRSFGSASVLSLIVNAAFQDAQAPGSLTEIQLLADPRQADSRYIAQNAGKESTHVQGGLTLLTQTSAGTLSATVYGISRVLENSLTYAWINLDRHAGGMYAQLRSHAGSLAWHVGLDTRMQRDDRQTYDNAGGRRGNSIQLDQLERVQSFAAFAALQLRLNQRFGSTAGLRLDRIRFAMSDRYLANDDQSGNRNFRALSSSLGIYYQLEAITAYGNISTSFETPTTNELINSPVIVGGFNPDLNPQRTMGLELGLRGLAPEWRLSFDAALFQQHIRDRLVPNQNADGRTWYANAGRNRHEGLELLLRWPSGAPLNLELTYNYSHFVFLNDPGPGLHIPGVPIHYLHLAMQANSLDGWFVELAVERVSDIFADSDNQAKSSGYAVLDLYLARTDWTAGSLAIRPFLRVQNLFNAKFSGSHVVNAFGGRYFEPAAERSFQIGLGLVL